MDTTKTLEQLKQRFLEQYGSYEFVGILDNAGYPRSETMQRIETLVERVFLTTLDAVEEAMPKYKPMPPQSLEDLAWQMRKPENMDADELRILLSKTDNHKRDMFIVAAWNHCRTEALAAITDLREKITI